jgi:hypothetical protein
MNNASPVGAEPTGHILQSSAASKNSNLGGRMGKSRHRRDTKQFHELPYDGQAKSINATIVNLQREIRRHIRDAKNAGRDDGKVRAKCKAQLQRLLGRL